MLAKTTEPFCSGTRITRRGGILACTLLALALAQPGWTREPRVLDWMDLVPQGAEPAGPQVPPGAEDLDHDSGPDDWRDVDAPYISMYSFNVVDDLDGEYVQIPGFIVPLESDEGGWLEEFLLVPYYGACIHVPPPPPNQLVYVKLDEPFYLRSMWDPFWITGTMETRRWYGDFAESHYVLSGVKVEAYEW